MKEVLKITTGVILMPVFYALFISDRAFCSINPFVDLPKFKKWVEEPYQVIYSLTRILVFIIITLILWLIS